MVAGGTCTAAKLLVNGEVDVAIHWDGGRYEVFSLLRIFNGIDITLESTHPTPDINSLIL